MRSCGSLCGGLPAAALAPIAGGCIPHNSHQLWCSFYIVTYALGIYNLNLLLGFLRCACFDLAPNPANQCQLGTCARWHCLWPATWALPDCAARLPAVCDLHPSHCLGPLLLCPYGHYRMQRSVNPRFLRPSTGPASLAAACPACLAPLALQPPGQPRAGGAHPAQQVGRGVPALCAAAARVQVLVSPSRLRLIRPPGEPACCRVEVTIEGSPGRAGPAPGWSPFAALLCGQALSW